MVLVFLFSIILPSVNACEEPPLLRKVNDIREIVRHTYARNMKSIACMVAYTTEKNGLLRSDYPPELSDLGTFVRSVNLRQPLCVAASGLMSEPGTYPISLKNTMTTTELAMGCRKDFSEFRDEIVNTNERLTPYNLFKLAMKKTGNDAVQALVYVTLFLQQETTGRKRSENPILKKLSPISAFKLDDQFGQFYHWWGNLTLSYTIKPSFRKNIYRSLAVGYELGTKDFEDLLHVDYPGQFSGDMFACFDELFGNSRARQITKELGCENLDFEYGFESNFTFLSREWGTESFRENNPHCASQFDNLKIWKP